MLFDMRFDRRKPRDGRLQIGQADFERALASAFPDTSWTIERTYGPVRQKQRFDQRSRSFEAPAKTIESTAVEYLITRTD